LTAKAKKSIWAIVGLVVLVGLVVMAWSTEWLDALGANVDGSEVERMRTSPQFDQEAGEFFNPGRPPVTREGTTLNTTEEWLFGDEIRVPTGQLPMNREAEILATQPSTGLRVTWLGHSTTLIEIDGVRFLTDPIWSERASPSSILGPKRFHEPPLEIDEIGALDAVLISHDHYDHLDMRTIRRLADDEVMFFVPLGVAAHLEQWGVPAGRIVEKDWWESAKVGDVEVVSTPAQHFSGRGVFDRNSTLWTSWTLVGPRHRVFFSGDTGLAPQFGEVGERYGPFDVTMFEVGAYHPNWGTIHLGPEQAVDAHEIMGGEGVMLPIHWGTFELAMHGWTEPAAVAAEEARRRGLKLTTPQLGEPFEPTVRFPTEPWWENVD
jgi:L-ascorbate metabolism protein UlaG (beta-lactamase superfamily)